MPRWKEVKKPMKKFIVIALAIMVTFVLAASAFAVGPGKTVEFQKGGNVVFDGTIHAKAKCNECHPALFKMKKGGDAITMKDMNDGKFCGSCHNGTKAFSVKDAAGCAKCHKK
jgi:c(7)-type cytochrome triheme protein